MTYTKYKSILNELREELGRCQGKNEGRFWIIRAMFGSFASLYPEYAKRYNMEEESW